MSKTNLAATTDDDEPEGTLVEAQDDEEQEQEELDTTDYGEYKQEPIQRRQSRSNTADVVPNTDSHASTTSTVRTTRRQPRTTQSLKRPRVPVTARVGNWLQRSLLYIGMGMLITLMLWILTATYVLPLWVSVSMHWTYGGDVPLTQWDANVGHNGTSHFLAEYWRGEVVVIEYPGQDPIKARTYVFLLNTRHDTTHRLITLHVEIVNLHGQKGKPDVVIQVQGYSVASVLYNTGDAFTTIQP